jgi:hypothetical protein
MKIYKDEEGFFHAFEEDGSQDFLIKEDMVQITHEQHMAELDAQRQAALDARPYTEKRQAEYPSFFEYLDGVIKGDQAQIDKYIADCLAVKAKYPKPD